MPFYQSPPELGNQYVADDVLKRYLRNTLPEDMLSRIEPELSEIGELAGGDLYRQSIAQRLDEPRLDQWDAWGNRVDHIELSPLWKRAARITAEKGLIGDGLRAEGRRLLARPPVREGLPDRQRVARLLVPARDDRRRGAHADRLEEPGAHRPRRPAPHEPRPGAGVDERPVDDRAHRRLRRRDQRDGRACEQRRRVAPARDEVVQLRDDLADGAHAGPPRGQPAGRQRPRALLSSRSASPTGR